MADMNEIKKVIQILYESIPETNYKNFEYEFIKAEEIMKMFFKNYFNFKEGSGGSVDKAGFVANQCIKSLTEDKIFNLQVTYDIKKHPQMKKYQGQIAYWCPETIKNTKEAMGLFTKALLNMHKIFSDDKL